MTHQQAPLPALRCFIALQFGIDRHQKLQPGIGGTRIGLHVPLGERQRLGVLPQPLVSLHQHLQDFFTGLGRRRAQQADDLGIATLQQVQPGQVQTLACHQALVQLAAGDSLLQQFQRLPVVTFCPGEVSLATP